MCFEDYFKHVIRIQFSSFLLLHSNSQLANLPAKNASWASTPIWFTVFGRVNQGFSDTWRDVEECSPCTAACPWKTDSDTSLSTPSDVRHFQHRLMFIWRTLTLKIHHKRPKKLHCRNLVSLDWCAQPVYIMKAVKKVTHFALLDKAYSFWMTLQNPG